MPNNLYFDTVFGVSGDRTTVPDGTQSNGSVSYTQGYPITYSTPVAGGGIDFPRAQHNQVLYDITAAIQNVQQNGAPNFITTAMNGGVNPFTYILGAIVNYDGGSGNQVWISTQAANTTIPGAGGAHWTPLTAPVSVVFTGATSTGSANIQAVTTAQGNFTGATGEIVTFTPGLANTAACTLAIDSVSAMPLKMRSPLGLVDPSANTLVATEITLVISDGTNLQILSSSPNGISGIIPQSFNSSGAFNYVPSSGLVKTRVRAQSGGGGGGGGTGTCGPGAAGAYRECWLTAAQVNALLTSGHIAGVVGAGGTAGGSGGAAGGNGGTTSLTGVFSMTGGSGGNAAGGGGGGVGGAPGSLSVGTDVLAVTGQTSPQTSTTAVISVTAASSSYGGGGFGGVRGGTETGGSASGFGAGGGGGNSASAAAGGTGSGGFVIFEDYCSS